MKRVKIYHNPRCSKSRNALALLEEKGLEIEVVKYLETTPSKEELKEILTILGCSAKELIRTKEKIYKELGLEDVSDEDKLIDAMVTNPKLIERPIIFKDNNAVIGRPLENIDQLF